MKARTLSLFVLFLSLAGLIYGMGWLLHLRFSSGDAYAPRSTMRADPMGSKAFHDALVDYEGLSVSRNFTPFDQLQSIPSDAALLMLGADAWRLSNLANYEIVRDFVKAGGRLVIALDAEQVAFQYLERDDGNVSEDEKDAEEAEGADPDEDVSFIRRFKDDHEFWAELSMIHGEHEGGRAMRSEEADTLLPAEVPWREGGVIASFDEAIWTPLYRIEEEVVAASRQFGDGTVILMTDDYLFSNEALLQHRYSDFLVWMLGAKTEVLFEETHLGFSERTGIANLIRRYGLAGFVVAFFLCALLVIWRGACPLLPAFTARSGADRIELEHSSEEGLGDLLRRSVRYAEMPALAYAEWKKAFVKTEAQKNFYAQETAEAEKLLAEAASTPRHKQRPWETHLEIKKIMNRKKRRQL